MDLVKHVAGQPLTEAELEQRRAAARARWDARGASVAGAAAGAVGADLALRHVRQAHATQIRRAVAGVVQARQLNAARAARHDNTELGVSRRLRVSMGGSFLDQADKTLGNQVRRASNALRGHFDATAEDVDLGDAVYRLSPDVERLSELRDHRDDLKTELWNLRADGRAERKVDRRGATIDTVQAHTRVIKGPKRPLWSASAHDHLAHTLAAFGLPAPAEPEVRDGEAAPPALVETARQKARRESLKRAGIVAPAPKSRRPQGKRAAAGALEEHREQLAEWMERVRDPAVPPNPDGDRNWDRLDPTAESHAQVRETLTHVRSLDDIERLTNGMSGRARHGWLRDHFLPYAPMEQTWKEAQVSVGGPRGRKSHKTTVPGFPPREERQVLADRLRADVAERAGTWRSAENKAAAWRMATARMKARAGAHAPLVRLAVLRHPSTRAAAAVAGAIATGIGSYYAQRGLQALIDRFGLSKVNGSGTHPLRKAARRPKTAQNPPAAAIDSTEAEVAQRLAAAFGSLKDTAAQKIAAPDGTSLHQVMVKKLGHALEPLDAAAHAGAAEPMPVVGGPGGRPLAIAVTMLARSPHVQRYIEQYRQDRVAELADEQREAIKVQLVSAAMSGAGPDEMARRVKETVGLTAHQGQLVQNYRAELVALHPGALGRQLRDRRFDRTVDKAIRSETALKPEQVDKMVDAYHRRFLAYRAMTIARTESVGAANNGQVAAARELLAQHPGFTAIKRWIATEDERTRHDHAELNGVEVLGLDTPFVCDSGDEILWPHDPGAPARQLVNCRCSFGIVIVPAAPDADHPQATQPE